MNTMEIIITVILVLLGILLILALVIDHNQVRRHEKIKKDHLKSLRGEKN